MNTLTPEKRAELNERCKHHTRYFVRDGECEEDFHEVTKEEFDAEGGTITTEEHTMFTNGVNQTCHTKEAF